jgi:membrane-bound inhibitor of C-type lysozyme
MAGPHQCSPAESGWQVRAFRMNPPVGGKTMLTALLLLCGSAGAVARDAKPVSYTCLDGTSLQAVFSPAGSSMGSVKLFYAEPSSVTTLPQAISADGGRYTLGDVEFWIKGNGATLTRAGKSTTCKTGS